MSSHPRMTVVEAMRHDPGVVIPSGEDEPRIEAVPQQAFDAAVWHWSQLELHVHQRSVITARLHLVELAALVDRDDPAQGHLTRLLEALSIEPNWDAASGLLEALRAAL